MQSATKLEEPQLAALERKEEHLRCIALRVWRSWSWRSRSWQRWGGAPPLQPCARQLRSPFSGHCYLFSFFGDCNFQWLLFAVWTVYLSHPIECAHAVVICRLHGTRIVILCALLCLTC